MGYSSESFYISDDNAQFCKDEANRICKDKNLKRYNKSQYLDDVLDELRKKSKRKKQIKKAQVFSNEQPIGHLNC